MRIQKQDLLLHGIVDGLLNDGEPINKIKKNIDKFNVFSLEHLGYRKEKLYTSKDIHFTPQTVTELGIILGFPPECAVMWEMYLPYFSLGYVSNIYQTVLNYNGICFNTMGMFEYALEWCENKYHDIIMKTFGRSKIQVFNNLY